MQSAETKDCPLCRAKMPAKALFCASCKSFVNKPVEGQAKKAPLVDASRPKKKSGPGSVIKKGSAVPSGISSYPSGSSQGSNNQHTTSGNARVAVSSPVAPSPVDGESMVIRIADLQAIVQEVNNQIRHSMAVSADPGEREKEREQFERIIRVFAEKYSERTISTVNRGAMEREYEIEEKKIATELGRYCWERLEPSARNLLVSSRLVYSSLLAARGETDYSGSCLLSLRALEVLMFRLFYTNFIRFMNRKYPGRENMAQWPTALLNKYDKKKPTRKFSLIGVSFVLCYKHSAGNSARRNENNLAMLLEYAREKLLAKDPGDKAIEKMMHDFAEHIEKICNDPRNPAENAGEVKEISASDCLSFNSYIEKLIKRTLETFNA